MRRLLPILALAFLAGCSTTYTLKSADGLSSVTDSNPLDSVVALSSGPGCQVPNPYVAPPAPTPAPIALTEQKVCDVNGGNCQNVMMAHPMAVDPSTICNTAVAQTKGVGLTGFLGGIAGIAGSIALLVGTGGI